MNPDKEIKMKGIFKLSLCAVLAFGLVISTTSANQERETPKVDQDDHSSEIKELTIRKSGFRSRSTIVIRYRDKDKKIVEVIENGKKLPPEEFVRYESVFREVLEISQIDRLLPEIERIRRRVESASVSEESKIRDMLALRRKLDELESEEARRYRDLYEFLIMEELNNQAEKISDSSELSQEEKIAQLKEIVEKIKALELAEKEEHRRTRLAAAEFRAINAARRLLLEINKSSSITREEKIEELKEILQHMRDMGLGGGERHLELIEIDVANALGKMLQDVVKSKELTDQEKEKEFEKILQEAKDMQLKTTKRRIDIEKFKFDLHRLLKKEELLPEGEAEFVLKLNECTVDGKKLPKEIHLKILRLCEEDLGKKFTRKTKVILGLNEDR